MKKALSIIAALALVSGAAHAVQTNKVDSVVAKIDTIATSVAAGQDTLSTASSQNSAKVVTTDDGTTLVLYDGASYPLNDIMNHRNWNNAYYSDTDFENEVERKVTNMSSMSLLCTLLICFGIPAIAILVALYLILKFFTHRNRERNALIAQAIDNGYQLPDSFYLNQRAEIDSNNASATGPQRDPQKFQSAITMISAGIALSVFFWVIETPFGFIAGGIPLLLGIGQLIGYFYIPGFGSKNNQWKNNRQSNEHFQNVPNNGQSCPPPPPAGHYYYDPRDPRYNGNR